MSQLKPRPRHANGAIVPLAPGTAAPDFRLLSTPDQLVSLRDFRGQPVILAFYPADWSPVCSDQMGLYNEILSEFRRYNAELLGISVDGAWCHLAFARDRKLRFPLLSDFEPKGQASRLYGAYQHDVGESARALFVVDSEGLITWSYVSPVGINPGANGILDALDALPTQKKGHQTWAPYALGPHLTLSVGERDHAQGPATARVTLVEYGDYECPHCGRAYPIVKEVQRRLGDRLRFVFRNFPLSEAHPHAEHAAEAAEAAGAQGKFWEMHDYLFEHQQALDDRHLVAYAEHLHLDVPQFERDLVEQRFARRVREDFLSGVRSGVNGTPTFFVNGQRYDGSYDVASLVAAVEAAEREA